ncbi:MULTISPECIES: hypothetical protein [unclassified Microcoleus]
MAHRIETKRQQGLTTVLGIRGSKLGELRSGRSAAAHSLTSNVE